MMQVVVTEPAEIDLADIWQWIAEDHPLNAERYVAFLESKCQSLAKFPRVGRPREDLGPECRGLNVDAFIIVYRIRNKTVQVLRVLDGRQDLTKIRIRD